MYYRGKEAFMALIKLNNDYVRDLMARARMRPVDMARVLGVSKQLANHIIHHGGVSYAASLARIFDKKEIELLVALPRKTRAYKNRKEKE
jgi:hypothetical protein